MVIRRLTSSIPRSDIGERGIFLGLLEGQGVEGGFDAVGAHLDNGHHARERLDEPGAKLVSSASREMDTR
jgi:hypothetical protein